MTYIPSIDEILNHIEWIVESLENQPHGEDYYVAVELAHQLRDEISEIIPEEVEEDE